MIDLQVKEEQMKYAQDMVDSYNFGQRGIGDGNEKEQFVGILGQTVFADLLNLPRPDGGQGFDDGVDFLIREQKIDIKTMSRTVPVKAHYVHNFIGYQKDYSVDFYVFASYNTKNNSLSVCGIISKEEFFKKASFYAKGVRRYRDDGSSFINKAPLYEILQSDLLSFFSVDELLKKIA